MSRFVSEIPTALLEKEEPKREQISVGGGYRAWGTVSPAANRPRTYYHDDAYEKTTRASSTAYGTSTPKPAAATIFEVGTRVHHAVFGDGEILSVKPMGADTLYEIMFDRTGTKKLMASYAKLKKI